MTFKYLRHQYNGILMSQRGEQTEITSQEITKKKLNKLKTVNYLIIGSPGEHLTSVPLTTGHRLYSNQSQHVKTQWNILFFHFFRFNTKTFGINEFTRVIELYISFFHFVIFLLYFIFSLPPIILNEYKIDHKFPTDPSVMNNLLKLWSTSVETFLFAYKFPIQKKK